jgi:glycosyltransferase involved in cell wall biosynthesis
MVFTGVMDYFPNVDAVQHFCEDIFPLVRRAVPESQFYIVGRNPTPQVKKLAKQRNVVVTGEVPDVRPFLSQARVAVAPFRIARGVQNKVLEAMAMELPVVGTAECFKGIKATDADGTRVASDADTFAQYIIDFLRDDATRSYAGQQARRYVEYHHRWEEQGTKLESLIEEVVWRKNRSSGTLGSCPKLSSH